MYYDGIGKGRFDRLQDAQAREAAYGKSGVVLGAPHHDDPRDGVGGVFPREVYFGLGRDARDVYQSDTDVRAGDRVSEYPRVLSEKAEGADSRFYRRHRLLLYLYSFHFGRDLSV